MAAPSCWILQGVQRVSKFREQARNTVLVYMAVLRLPTVDSDIVIHYRCANKPYITHKRALFNPKEPS